MKKLTLAEEFLLLSLDDEKGVVCNQPFMGLEFGLAGALLKDLQLLGKIKVEKDAVYVTDASSCEDEMFNDALDMIREEPQVETPSYWVWKLGVHIQEIKDYFLEHLVDMGILEKRETNILFYHRKCYPLLDDRTEENVKTRIKKQIMKADPPAEREIVLISLMKSCNLMNIILSPDEEEKYGDRIVEIARMDIIGQAVYQSIYDILQKLSVQQLYY